jgi:hypothetical protein
VDLGGCVYLGKDLKSGDHLGEQLVVLLGHGGAEADTIEHREILADRPDPVGVVLGAIEARTGTAAPLGRRRYRDR